MQDFDVRKVMEKAEKMFEKSPLSVGNWEDFDEKIMMQPVPFIRMQRLQMEIFSGQASENVFNNNSGTEKSTNRRPTYGNKNLIVVDTRDSARYKKISVKNSMNLPFDDEFDFTAALYEFSGRLIVLLGELNICSKLALQLVEMAMPNVCILYEDIELDEVFQDYKEILVKNRVGL